MDTLETRLQKRIHASLYALLFLTVLLGLSVLLEGCTDTCEVTQEYTYYEPVYTTVQEIRESVELTTPQPVHAVGKIYFKDGVLFLNEPGEGIHLIDNSDPSHPSAFGFLRIPGNYDLAIKGNTLYADSYVDLIAFNIADLANIAEVGRLEGVFRNYTSMGFMNDVNCCVITDWTPKKLVSVYESECGVGNIQPWGGIFTKMVSHLPAPWLQDLIQRPLQHRGTALALVLAALWHDLQSPTTTCTCSTAATCR
ncbi:MAG: hypothetical protein HC859_14475 [Bacteroidia bacterium]|nr:hypothetical protein [Bacteroidia bacterium]